MARVLGGGGSESGAVTTQVGPWDRTHPDVNDVRAPRTVAEHLHAAITGSTLVVLPGAGHLCNVEAADDFNTTVGQFLRQPT